MRVIAGEFRGRKLLAPEGEATRPITDRVKQSLFDILTPRLEGAIVWDLFAGTGSLGLESLSRGSSQALFFETDRSAVCGCAGTSTPWACGGTGQWSSQPTCSGSRAWDKPVRLGTASSPSPGTPGEGRGEGLSFPRAKDPHPNPLPEYRERGPEAKPNRNEQRRGFSGLRRPCAGGAGVPGGAEDRRAPIVTATPPQADIIFLDPPYRYLRQQPENPSPPGRLFARQHLRPEGIVVFRHDARDTLELPGLTRYDERTYGGMTLEFLRIAE